MARLLLHELTREEARAVAPETLLILPLGATEQHGPHLPVGTDALVIEHIARAAAAEAADRVPVLVAPTLPFGSSHHHLPFGGTMSLSTETFYRVVYDLGETLITSGFRRIFLLNGHGGNDDLIRVVARDLALKHPVSIAAALYATIAWDALIKEQAYVGGRLPGHSGAFETSLILALRPELVKERRPHREQPGESDPRSFYGPYRVETHDFWQSIDGYTDSPAQATAEQGSTYFRATVRAVATAFVEFYLSAGADPSKSAPALEPGTVSPTKEGRPR